MELLVEKLEKAKLGLDNLSVEGFKYRFEEIQTLCESMNVKISTNLPRLYSSLIRKAKTGFSVKDIEDSKRELVLKLKHALITNCDFILLSINQQILAQKKSNYIDTDLIRKFQNKKNSKYSTNKLVQYLKEINSCYSSGNIIATSMLIRAILNYVPPIFGCKSFWSMVTTINVNRNTGNNDIFFHLQTCARSLGDLHNHDVITKHNFIPTANQVDPYKGHFEYLLQEILKRL